MNNSSLIILGLLVPLIAALGSFVFQKNINLRDSFGVIGGIITFIISLIIFDGIKNFQEFSISLFPLIQGVDFTFRITPFGFNF